MKVCLLVAGLLLWGLFPAEVVRASVSLPMPEGRVILEVTGDLERINVGKAAHFDRAMLQALPQHEYSTGTPWTDQAFNYRGPLMRDLLAYLGADSERVHVSALNGYSAYIPTRDFVEHDVLLALERDGEPISIRDYGPLWVLYPFDQNVTLLSETYRFRAVWQVKRIHVR